MKPLFLDKQGSLNRKLNSLTFGTCPLGPSLPLVHDVG